MLWNVAVGVVVTGLVGAVDMGMAVDVGMLVAVDQIAVAVRVGMGVAVRVGVLQPDGVSHHQHRGGDHDSQTQIEPDPGPFSQENHAEEDP